MRSRLLAAALLALATSCAEPCRAPLLTTAWTFTLADGSSGVGCLAAGVAKVNLWIDGQEKGMGMACEQGAASFAGLAAGDHDFTIQGVDAGGTVRYQTWGTVTVASCGETRVLLEPGAGTLRLAYATATGQCYAPGDATHTRGYVWFRLLDWTTKQVASTISSAVDPTRLPCQTGTQAQVNIPLPWGLYRLAWMQVVLYPSSTDPTPIYQVCPPVDPAGADPIDASLVTTGVTTVPVALPVPSATCP